MTSKYKKRIGEHYVRNHLKECTIKASIHKRVYPHMLRASSITFMLNKQINPKTVQVPRTSQASLTNHDLQSAYATADETGHRTHICHQAKPNR